ncbi:MAG: response regulator [Deltaproteobacteria bacterium]|nr:response regulator [Deltaproteobacteria bacterium]
MAAKGCPFPGSKELFDLCRALSAAGKGPDRGSDAELGRLIGFENARTSRWKHGKIEVADAAKLLALSRALEVDLAILIHVAAGSLRAREAIAIVGSDARHLRFTADNLVPGAEGRSVCLTDAAGHGWVVERLGPHKLERREVVTLDSSGKAPVPPRRRVALLADDDPEVARLFLNVASKQPTIDPLVVQSFPHALVVAGRSRPDLVLVDLYLPGCEGTSALRALRSDPATSAARIVATSLHVTSEIVERARACGADDVVARPLEVRYLTRALRALL